MRRYKQLLEDKPLLKANYGLTFTLLIVGGWNNMVQEKESHANEFLAHGFRAFTQFWLQFGTNLSF